MDLQVAADGTLYYLARGGGGRLFRIQHGAGPLPTPPPPPNDDFADAQSLRGDTGVIRGRNVTATKEGDEPEHAGDTGGSSVWYSWKALATGPVRFDTAGSDFDTLLAIYTGSSIPTLAHIVSNDDDPENLAEQIRQGLGVRSVGVFSHRDIQLAIRAEVNRAAVMIRGAAQIVEPEEQFFTSRQGHVALCPEAHDAIMPGRSVRRVIQVDKAIRPEIGIESHAEQSALTRGVHIKGDEWRREQRAILDHAKLPGLLTDENPSVWSNGRRRWSGQTTGDQGFREAGRENGGFQADRCSQEHGCRHAAQHTERFSGIVDLQRRESFAEFSPFRAQKLWGTSDIIVTSIGTEEPFRPCRDRFLPTCCGSPTASRPSAVRQCQSWSCHS